MVAENAQGEIVGAVPCYLKSHSRGEYVFDRGWAEAYERVGGSYYPKLQVSVPFTPATGPRLLARRRPAAGTGAGGPRRRTGHAVPRADDFIGPPHLPARDASALPRHAGISSAHRPAVPLEQCRLRLIPGFPRRARLAQAQDDPARTCRGACERHHRALAERKGPERRRVGCLLRFLYGNRLAQMGPAVSDPRILFTRRRAHGRPHPAGDGQARRQVDRRRDQFHRPRRRSMAATGVRSSITRCCISRSAIIRRSTMPSPTASPGSRRAPKANTNLPAVTCPQPPIPRISSPIPALRRAVADYLVRERAYVAAEGAELAALAPFRKDFAAGQS